MQAQVGFPACICETVCVKLDVLRENCPLVFWCVFFSFSELLANEYYTYTWGMSQNAPSIAFTLDVTLMRNVTGVPFKFDATSAVLVILMTSGTFSTSVGWAVDEDGQPLVPPVSQSNSANMFKWVALLFTPLHSSCQTLGAVIRLFVCIFQLKPWGSLMRPLCVCPWKKHHKCTLTRSCGPCQSSVC